MDKQRFAALGVVNFLIAEECNITELLMYPDIAINGNEK